MSNGYYSRKSFQTVAYAVRSDHGRQSFDTREAAAAYANVHGGEIVRVGWQR